MTLTATAHSIPGTLRQEMIPFGTYDDSMLQIFVNTKYDFIGKRRWAYLISIVVTLAGLGHIAWQGGLRYGIDFSGGTLVQVRFQQATTVDAVRKAAKA